jgi:hypothetical protein
MEEHCRQADRLGLGREGASFLVEVAVVCPPLQVDLQIIVFQAQE